MHHKNEAPSLLKGFWELVSMQSGHQIKAIRVDNGTEYGNIQGFCHEKGMKLEFSTPYTVHQNCVSERSNGLVCTKARAMLHAAGLPGRFWGEAVKTAVYLLNRPVQGSQTRTPYEHLSRARGNSPMVPDLSHLRVFGCSAFLHTPEEKRLTSAKFEAHAANGIFFGYEGDSIYRIWTKKGLSLSSSVTFNEGSYGFSTTSLPSLEEEVAIFPLPVLRTTAPGDSLPSMPRIIKSGGALEPENLNFEVPPQMPASPGDGDDATSAFAPGDKDEEDNGDVLQEADRQHSESPERPPPASGPAQLPRRSSRPHKPRKVFGALANGVTSIPVVAHTFLAGMDYSMDESEPHGYREAMASLEHEKWLIGMKEEVQLLNQMKTWQLVKPPLAGRS